MTSDPDNDPLVYSWSASGGVIEGSGREVRWNSVGVLPGPYTVMALVDDGHGGHATCSVIIRVEETKAVRPPDDLKVFPLPAPRASAEQLLPDSLFAGPNTTTLRDVDRVLSAALDATGYGERSYLWVPDGFALVTRLEQIYPDGRSKKPPARFSTKPLPLSSFSLGDYFRALFTADPGYYRVIVFVVTPQAFSQTNVPPSEQEMGAFLAGGDNKLPPVIAEKPRPANLMCTALIYEFENAKTSDSSPITPSVRNNIDGKQHLRNSGLWGALHLP
jgi:hypothetical protein